MGFGTSQVIGVGVQDFGQANVPAAESAVNSETAGYKSCTSGNQKYYQVDLFSHPADPQPPPGQPYPRQYEMHGWLGVCSTETTEGHNGAFVQWNYYYGSDSRYCGGCNYYQIDQIWLRGRAWDCGSLYYDNIVASYPGYVIGEQSPVTNAGTDCGAQGDLQAYWQSNNNWGASGYINQDPHNPPSCSPCINVSRSQANQTGVAAIGVAAAPYNIRRFSTVGSSRMADLVQLKDPSGRRILASTAPLDAWIVVATAPPQAGLTTITGWAVVNARSGVVIAAGETHTVDGATPHAIAQGSAVRPA